MGVCHCLDREDKNDYKEALVSDSEEFDQKIQALPNQNVAKEEININEEIDINDNKIKYIFYDFDQTVTVIHLYHLLHGGRLNELEKISDQRLIDIFGGNERIQRLDKHFNILKSNNIKCCILSFGFESVIKKALQRVNLLQHFFLIIGRDSNSLKQAGGNKAICIEQFIIKENCKKTQILFVDDDQLNVAAAMNKNIKSMVINPRKGMNDTHMTQIENSFL